jgi:RES domain-containing protein
MTSLLSNSALGGLATPSFNPAVGNGSANLADAFMRGGKLDIDLLAQGLGQLSVSNQAMASQIFAELTPQFKQLSASDQGTFDRLLKSEIANAAPNKEQGTQPGSAKTTAIKTQYGTFKVSEDGTLTPDKFRTRPMGTPEFKLWKDVHDGLMRNKDPEMGTPAAENAAARWVFYSEGKISVDQISTLNQILGGSAAAEKALAEYNSQGVPLNATFELPQHAPLRYFTEYKAEQKRLEAALDVQSRGAANPGTTADQQRINNSLAQNARTGVELAWQRFEVSKTPAGRAQLEFQYQNSDAVLEANAQATADREVGKLLAIAFAGPAIGAGAALLPEALALYRGGQAIKAGITALAGTEQVTGGLNTLRTGGESQTGIVGGLINAATGTRAGDTISLVIQLAPEVYGVVALGKAAMTSYPGKAQALKAADALDDAAFKRGEISQRAPQGTEREVLQTPEVKVKLADEAARKAEAAKVEAEAVANEIVVTGKVKAVAFNPKTKPKGVEFQGTIFRLENPSRVNTTFDAHAGNLAADHRYSGPGQGAIYGATSPETAFAEIEHYGLVADRVPVSKTVKFENVLDLTNPAVRRQINVKLDQITGDSYKLTQKVGDWARTNGYDGILAPSARDSNGSNLIIFPGDK